jgi:hypothetical protein
MNDRGRLSRLEARMESLVEGTFARLFAGHIHPREVVRQLARALEDSAAAGTPGTRYQVRLNPADARDLLDGHPDLADQLSRELLGLAREARLTLALPPLVDIVADANRPPHTIAVTCDIQSVAPGATQTIAPAQPAEARGVSRAFIIVDGRRTINLTDRVINIGRRLDNQIILDDPRVSRSHAQLRLRFGHYVLYNLGATGGTFVNGLRVEECVLRPGDVISLGGVPLIYGEDSTQPGAAARPSHSTKPLVPPKNEPGSGPERP